MSAANQNNIIDWFNAANEGDIEEGMHWYEAAHRIASHMANTYGLTTSQVVGVIAALSPQCKWSKNVVYADKLIYSVLRTFSTLDSIEYIVANTKLTFKSNMWKAASIVRYGNAINYLGGRKVNSFYHNMLLPNESTYVTVDRHAIRIWANDDDINAVPEKLYNDIEDDYRAVAKTLGILPHQLQAITWCAYRRIKSIS